MSKPILISEPLSPDENKRLSLIITRLFNFKSEKFTKELENWLLEKEVLKDLRLQSYLSLIKDLVTAGWKLILERNQKILIYPPDSLYISNKDILQSKQKLRESHLARKNEQLNDEHIINFVSQMEKKRPVGNEKKSVLDLVDNGSELAIILSGLKDLKDEALETSLKEVVKPELELCIEDKKCSITNLKLTDIWKYFRLTWSTELKSNTGRSLPILIRNKARPNKPVIGITQLSNAVINLTTRDNIIGWNSIDSLMKIISDGDISIEEISKRVVNQLNKSIRDIRYDDFDLSESHIKNPDEKFLKFLKEKLNTFERELEIDRKAPRSQKVRKTFYKVDGSEDWERMSETPLFKVKRLRHLKELLEVRLYFKSLDIIKSPYSAFTTILKSKKGKILFKRALNEVKTYVNSSQIIDLSVCGAISPYSELLGGKLVTLLMTSKELRDLYKLRYKSYVSIISSKTAGKKIIRPSEIIALTTTSLYGVGSSQYNRLKLYKKNHSKLKENILWEESKELTEGYGTYHIGKKTIYLLRELYRKVSKKRQVNYDYGEGSGALFRQLVGGLRSLNLHQDILKHNLKRYFYICKFYGTSFNRLVLGLEEVNDNTPVSNVQEITEAFIQRWLIKRIRRHKTLENLSQMGSDNIKNLISIDRSLKKNKRQYDFFGSQ